MPNSETNCENSLDNYLLYQAGVFDNELKRPDVNDEYELDLDL
jgi:hypothetical protein